MGQIRLGESLPKLQKNLLGWIIAGKSSIVENNSNMVCNIVNGDNTENINRLEDFVNKFCELEELPNRHIKVSEEHLQCEAYYKKNLRLLKSGRFEVKLPLRKILRF